MTRILTAGLFLLALSLLLSADKPLDFSDSPFDIPAEPPAQRLTLMFCGDIKLEGRTARQMAQHGVDYPFAQVADQLRGADLCYGNCETSITGRKQHTPGKPDAAVKAGRAFIFKSDPATSGKVLADAGFDVLQLANNHAMDYCGAGLLDTFTALNDAGIDYVGAGKDYAAARAAHIVETGGLRIGFIAFSMIVPPQSSATRDAPGINYLPANYLPVLKRDIAALRKDADLVVVGFHWGLEGSSAPSQAQRKIGRAAVDAGADLVIGTHTHSFQGIEHYGGGLIAYSLGNFVFSGKSPLLAGGILRVAVEPDGSRLHVAEAALLPCWVRDGVPSPSGEAGLRRKLDGVLKLTGSQLSPADGAWLGIQPRT